ncbi:MAG: Dicer-like protein 1 [Geoglossum umbratile]|nr:MAG: Dicer-like protein 1 [Geoglossum umbratile]
MFFQHRAGLTDVREILQFPSLVPDEAVDSITDQENVRGFANEAVDSIMDQDNIWGLANGADLDSSKTSHDISRISPTAPTQELVDGPLITTGNMSDTDGEGEATSSEQPNVSEKRRQQNAKFNSWFSNRAKSICKEDLVNATQAVDDALLSTKSLISKQESTVIITDPREYQTELFERAKKKNIIAVLDTGSGKTLIAVLLIRHILDQELEDRARGLSPRIVFFLVDSVTLVFQQHAVLKCNLDANIDRFCGDMGCDLWQKSIWEKHFSENMVIVCTAEVLYQCLMHSFITIDQINLLIFDEAHHAKKNHSYARIIKDFYLAELNAEKRPKVFGMTASPVDARVDVVKAARDLETLLHAQIATASDLKLLQKSVNRPREIVAQYDKLQAQFETPLHQQMKARFGDMLVLSKPFRFAKAASSELGSWFADQVWSIYLAEEEARKLGGKMGRDFLSQKAGHPMTKLDAEVARLREARELISQHTFRDPEAIPTDLSSKVLVLHHYLALVFERPTEAKCIVFVQSRYTAKLLGDLFSRIGGPNIRSGVLVGTRTGEPGELSVSFRQQVVTLINFRKGILNCLFATSVAEEGLDIPDCNVVVRFDLYGTLIQYIQSRGRARHTNSRYVHMIEKDNGVHIQKMRDVRTAEEKMRRFCESLPADRLLGGNDSDLDGLSGFGQRSLIDPETGAKLTYGSSLAVLSHFVSCLPCNLESTPQPTYIVSSRGTQFVCEVVLPENSPVLHAIGRPSSKKSIAKRSAAFEACFLLRKGKYLDANLLPIYHKQLPAMRNAQLALNLKTTHIYDFRVKPSLWAESVGPLPTELFLTILELAEPEGLGRACQPLGMLTRVKLLNFPRFPVYFENSKSEVICTSATQSIPVTSSLLETLTAFTLRIFHAIFNKVYEHDAEKTPYWLVPIEPNDVIASNDPDLGKLIQWDVVKLVADNEELHWDKYTDPSFFEDRFLVDPWDGGRRFFTVRVVPELKPLDPVPANAAPGKHMDNILEYSISLWKKARAKRQFANDQPVLEAHRVLHRRNWLDEITEKEKEYTTKCYICPEPLKISTIPVTLATVVLIFPAIITRLDSYLIADEVCKNLHLEVKTDLALEAITKDSDNSEEHREQQVHFQRGMGKNYERLEFLGDCFLKMSTSISLYTQNPDNDEFEYHVRRMLMICNQNLFNNALKLKLYEYIRTRSFSRRTWYPRELRLLFGKGHGKGNNTKSEHMLGDKSIADVSEALIGAALLSHNDFDNAVRAVTVLVCNPDHQMLKWADYYQLYTKPAYQTAQASASHLDLATKVELKHNYHFRYPRLLRSAFIHPSYPYSWEKIPCYQRLEFLGDSLFDMACVNFLFHRFPDKDPQWLTEHKMAMVSNRFLGAVCAKLGFHRHLRFNGSLIEHQIREYVTEIQEAERESNGLPDYWVNVKAPPKALPDAVEAYLGAIFVDSEFDYSEVERFFDAHIKWYFKDMSIYDSFANNHPTTYLNNLLAVTFACTNYRILAQEIPPIDNGSTTPPAQVIAAVMIHDEIIAEGRASSGRHAKVKASAGALEVLKGLAPFGFRTKFGCDCVKGGGGDIGTAV